MTDRTKAGLIASFFFLAGLLFVAVCFTLAVFLYSDSALSCAVLAMLGYTGAHQAWRDGTKLIRRYGGQQDRRR